MTKLRKALKEFHFFFQAKIDKDSDHILEFHLDLGSFKFNPKFDQLFLRQSLQKSKSIKKSPHDITLAYQDGVLWWNLWLPSGFWTTSTSRLRHHSLLINPFVEEAWQHQENKEIPPVTLRATIPLEEERYSVSFQRNNFTVKNRLIPKWQKDLVCWSVKCNLPENTKGIPYPSKDGSLNYVTTHHFDYFKRNSIEDRLDHQAGLLSSLIARLRIKNGGINWKVPEEPQQQYC